MSRESKHDIANPVPDLPSTNRRRVLNLGILVLAAAALAGAPAIHSLEAAQQGDGFDLSRTTVPREKLLAGGPPRDGIPAIDAPHFVAVDQAAFLKGTDRVAGIVVDGEARAYPLKILDYHEAVNDRIGETRFVVTYCPLAESVLVFDRRLPEAMPEFGVSGLLYNSNLVLYIRRPQGAESLVSQLLAEEISGPHAGRKLTVLPSEVITWADWTRRHPRTKVLSTRTGHRRNYERDPYVEYRRSPELMFPAEPIDRRLPRKSQVFGVWTGEAARAYPISAFREIAERREFEQELDGVKFTLVWNPDTRSLRIARAEGELHSTPAFWFAWYAFHPRTEVMESAGGSDGRREDRMADDDVDSWRSRREQSPR